MTTSRPLPATILNVVANNTNKENLTSGGNEDDGSVSSIWLEFVENLARRFPDAVQDGNTFTEIIENKVTPALWYTSLVALAVPGLLGNVVLFIMSLHSQIRSHSYSVFLTAVSLTDSFALVFLYTSLFLQMYSLSQDPRSESGCRVVYMVSGTLLNSSAWIQVAFTLDRFIATVFPLKRKVFCTVRNARIACTVVFVIILAVHTPFMLKIQRIPMYGTYICAVVFESFNMVFQFETWFFIVVPCLVQLVLSTHSLISIQISMRTRIDLQVRQQPASRQRQRGEEGDQPKNQQPLDRKSHKERGINAADRQADKKTDVEAADRQKDKKTHMEALDRKSDKNTDMEAADRQAEKQTGMEAADRQADKKTGMEAADRPADKKTGMEAADRPADKKTGMEAADRPADKKTGMEAADRPADKKTGMEAADRQAKNKTDIEAGSTTVEKPTHTNKEAAHREANREAADRDAEEREDQLQAETKKLTRALLSIPMFHSFSLIPYAVLYLCTNMWTSSTKELNSFERFLTRLLPYVSILYTTCYASNFWLLVATSKAYRGIAKNLLRLKRG